MLDLGSWTLGCWNLEFGIFDLFWDLGFSVWGLRFWIFWILGHGTLAFGFGDSGFWNWDFGFWVWGFGFWTLDFAFVPSRIAGHAAAGQRISTPK